MKMHEVEVEAKDSDILIIQPDGNGGDSIIALHPDQVELVCRWLKDAAAEIAVSRSKETQR